MHSNLAIYFLLLIIFIISVMLQAEPENADVPWDTLMAELQIIESMNEPDTVKAGLTHELFDNYDLQAADYSRFYNNFLTKPPEQQLDFLKKVENIILEMLKQVHEKKPEFEKRE